MYDVLYDPKAETAILVDPDNGRALGPLLAGPEDVTRQLFDAFIGALDTDVSTIHPADLDHHYRGFLQAMAEDEVEHTPPAAGDAAATQAATQIASGAAPIEGSPAAEPRPTEAAAPGETGGLAGSPTSTEQAPAGATGTSGAAAAGAAVDTSGVVADAGLPTGQEQARPGAEGTPGEAATPAGTEGAGVPKAPGTAA